MDDAVVSGIHRMPHLTDVPFQCSDDLSIMTSGRRVPELHMSDRRVNGHTLLGELKHYQHQG